VSLAKHRSGTLTASRSHPHPAKNTRITQTPTSTQELFQQALRRGFDRLPGPMHLPCLRPSWGQLKKGKFPYAKGPE